MALAREKKKIAKGEKTPCGRVDEGTGIAGVLDTERGTPNPQEGFGSVT